MTLREMVNLLKPKLLMMVIVSILCGLGVFAGLHLLIHDTYQATSTIVSNASLAVVKGYADNAASSGYDGVNITAEMSTTSNSVAITAKGSDANECMEAANDVATKTEEAAKTNLKAVTNVTWAYSVTNVTPKRYLYGIVVGVAVFLVLLVVIVSRVSIKRLILSPKGAQEILDIPCIGRLEDCGDVAYRQKLLTKARFVGRDNKTASSSICLIPVGEVNTAEKASNIFKAACGNDRLDVFSANPLSSNPNALMFVRKADTILLAVRQNQSSFSNAEAIVQELEMVGAKPVGFVFEASSKEKRINNKSKKSTEMRGKHS